MPEETRKVDFEEMNMTRAIKSAVTIAWLGGIALALTGGGMNAQEFVPQRSGQFHWRVNQRLVQSLGQNTQAGAEIGGSGAFADGSTTAIIAVCRKQSAAARSLVDSGPSSLNGSTRAAELNPQPLPPKASGTLLGPGQTMSSPGNANMSTGPGPGTLAAQPGAIRHQNPGADRSPQPAAARAPAPAQMCMNGIATVDGQMSGVIFMPISGPEGTFVIQGCGFGSKSGEVYLSGLHYPPSASNVKGNLLMFPDRLSLTIAQNGFAGGQPGKGKWQLGWSDRQIIAIINPAASGYFDTDNVSLVVKTASGQVYTAAGFRFFAAREPQTLTWIPTKAIQPGSSSRTAGHPMVANVLSPSAASLVLPGHTVAAIRDDNSATFPGGVDTLDLSNFLVRGFQVKSVQQFTAALTTAGCQSIPPGGGHFTTNGTWGVTPTGDGAFTISWQEQSCATQSTSGPNVSIGSVSAYALDITVIGPRGVAPLVTTGTLQVVH